MDHPRAASELATQFRALGDYINSSGDPSGSLGRIVTLAKQSIAGCDWAAITRALPTARTLAVSDETARLIDEVQIRCGEGPCVTAAHDATVVHVDDLATDDRWPVFAARGVADTPVRAVLSFELETSPARSALNLYAGKRQAFGEDSLSAAALFASHAQLAMMHLNAARKSANLEQALSTSRQIGIAIGILMLAHKISDEEAFAMLRQTSQNMHRKLRDIAYEVTKRGALP